MFFLAHLVPPALQALYQFYQRRLAEVASWVRFAGEASGCLGDLLGMKYYPVIWGGYFKKHIIRIPIKQPGFNWKAFAGCFSWLICCCFSILGFLIRRKVSPERMMFLCFFVSPAWRGIMHSKLGSELRIPINGWFVILLIGSEIRLTSWGWLFISAFTRFLYIPLWLAGFLPLTVSLIEAHMGNDNHLQVLVHFYSLHS